MNVFDAPTKQLTFRLPVTLIDRLEECVDRIQRAGLAVSRADVVRMLLLRALDAGNCGKALFREMTTGDEPKARRPNHNHGGNHHRRAR